MSTKKTTKRTNTAKNAKAIAAPRRGHVDYKQLEELLDLEQQSGSRYGLSSQDFAVASLVVVQHNATMEGAKAHEGYFYNFASRQYTEDVEVIVAGLDHPRTLKDEEATRRERKTVYACASSNGLSPLPDFLGQEVEGEIIPALCKECPFNASDECRPRYRYYGFIVDREGGPLRQFSYKPIFSTYGDMKAWNIELMEDEANNDYWIYRLVPVEGSEWWHTQVERVELIKDAALIEGVNELRKQHRRQQLDSVARILNAVE